MSSMKFKKTEAIILKKTNVSDHHKIVTLFTRDYGKMSAMARGVRKIRSKMAAHIEIGTHIECVLIEGKKYQNLSSVRSKTHFGGIRSKLSKAAELYFIAEMLDKLTDEQHPDLELFHLTQSVLLYLENCNDSTSEKVISSAFMIKLLKLSGYMPEIYTCVASGEKIQESSHYFSVEKGGLIKDEYNFDNQLSFSVDQIKLLRFFDTQTLDMARRVSVDPKEIEGIQKTLHTYIHYLLSQPMRSHAFIQRVKSLA